MAEIKLTKNELRNQQNSLQQLIRYLPTLELKKALLQVEVQKVRQEVAELREEEKLLKNEVDKASLLLTEEFSEMAGRQLEIDKVVATTGNIAGVEFAVLKEVVFAPINYKIASTPLWFDSYVIKQRKFIVFKEKIKIVEEKQKRLEEELRQVLIRVNLFEKVLIPRAESHIKKIRVFLGDQQLAVVAQCKVAKKKIMLRKMAGRR